MANRLTALDSCFLAILRMMIVPPGPTADVWVPRGPGGGQEAWDFSITSALRLGPVPPDPSSVESRKRAFLNTASQRTQAGISFCPLVIEAVGGSWSDALRSVVPWIASESYRCSPVLHYDASFKIAQRISCTLHREDACAILKRAPEQTGSHCCSLGLSLLSESVHDRLIPFCHAQFHRVLASPVKPLGFFLPDLGDSLYLLCFLLFFGAFLAYLAESRCALAACVLGLASESSSVFCVGPLVHFLLTCLETWHSW